MCTLTTKLELVGTGPRWWYYRLFIIKEGAVFIEDHVNGRPADNQDYRGRCARAREVNILSAVSVGIGGYQMVRDDHFIDPQRSGY